MILIVLTLLVIIASGITTIPFSVGLVILSAVLFRKSMVFFLALVLGLFLDLIMMRILGYSSLILTVFVLMVFLYERKFETQTAPFVFISIFLGSMIFLKIFGYQQLVSQALVNSLLGVLVFKILHKPNLSSDI